MNDQLKTYIYNNAKVSNTRYKFEVVMSKSQLDTLPLGVFNIEDVEEIQFLCYTRISQEKYKAFFNFKTISLPIVKWYNIRFEIDNGMIFTGKNI